MNRCKWCNLNNPKYIDYHDNEWGVLNLDDTYLQRTDIRSDGADIVRQPLRR